ncbi:MAG: MBL fold metallo-hydrolase [Oscillospiraceae bacterium]|jgi:hydroxyacylglutathione hydrolase
MTVDSVTVSSYLTNCYIVSDGTACAVIDPGDDIGLILSAVQKTGCPVRLILATHGHSDHVSAMAELKKTTGAFTAANFKDAPRIHCLLDGNAREGAVFSAGSMEFKTIETPGHTEGSVCYICGDCLFSGDTLFRGSAGRTDLGGGSDGDMAASLRKLRDLPYSDLRVYPGHMEATTLAFERMTNPYLR